MWLAQGYINIILRAHVKTYNIQTACVLAVQSELC